MRSARRGRPCGEDPYQLRVSPWCTSRGLRPRAVGS